MPEGLDTVGAKAGPHGLEVDAHLRAGDRLWAVGDVTGIRQLTHVGKYQGEVVASNILGEHREAHYEAIPDVVYTDPQAASVGVAEDTFSATAPLSQVAKTATYTHAYATVQRLPDPAQRRRAAHRRLRARPRGRRVDAAGHPRRPRPRPARRCCATSSSPSPPSPRSTSTRSRHWPARSTPPASRPPG